MMHVLLSQRERSVFCRCFLGVSVEVFCVWWQQVIQKAERRRGRVERQMTR